MRKKIQVMLAALALFIMTVADASCSKCNQENNRSNFRECLCALAGLGVKKNQGKEIVYVRNGRLGSLTCQPIGSYDCPYTNIAAAVAGSPPGAEIRVINNGTPYLISSTIQLKPRQVLKGWGSTRPTVLVSAYVGIILANRSRVLDLVFQAQGGSVGIESEGANNVTIRDNVFIGFDTSIFLIPVLGTKNTVKGNRFEGVGIYGIYAGPASPYGATNKLATKRASTKTFSAYELLIQDNEFKAPSSGFSVAIYTLGVGKLTVLENRVEDGYYAALGANIVSSTGLVDSEVNQDFAGISLEVAGNSFTEILGGNGAAVYSKMVIRDNEFSCTSSNYNLNAFGISLSAGNTACVTNNSFKGCKGTGTAAGFKVMVEGSIEEPKPCLQLTDNEASDNLTGRDYVLNTGSSLPLAINSNYQAMNLGSKVIGDLDPVNNCSQCSQ